MMAPPPLPEFVEVRCAGCAETLEVEQGLTEFSCPDCGTQQALPPELMPPPRPRRALPIPGRGTAAALPVPVPAPPPSCMPCASCSALLSVPAGLGRFACPVCGVELVVDGGRLRTYYASPAAATVSVVALPPTAVTLTSTYSRQPEANVERYNHPTRSDQTPAQYPSQSVHREETSSSFRHDTWMPIHSMFAQKEPLRHPVHGEESHIEPRNETAVRSSLRNSSLQPGTESIGLQKIQPEPSVQVGLRPQTQALPPSYSVHGDRTQGQHPDIATHEQQTNDASSIMEQGKIDRLNEAMNEEPAQVEDQCKTSGWSPNSTRSNKSTSVYQKRKRKGLTSSPNEGIPVRRSKRLTKQTEHPIEDEPVQTTASPSACNSDLPDIDHIIANLCPGSTHPHQMPHASSSESDNVDAAISPAFSNPGISQPEQFPHCYSQLYSPEVRGTHQLDKSSEQVKPQSPEGLHQPMHAHQV